MVYPQSSASQANSGLHFSGALDVTRPLNRGPDLTKSADRVRRSSADEVNHAIDRQTDANVALYAGKTPEDIERRIHTLDEEWDVERVLELNAATLALTGLLLGATVNRKWFLLPATVLAFLLQHSLQGWCPPLPVLRRLGVRTCGEIDRERYSLIASLQKVQHPEPFHPG